MAFIKNYIDMIMMGFVANIYRKKCIDTFKYNEIHAMCTYVFSEQSFLSNMIRILNNNLYFIFYFLHKK